MSTHVVDRVDSWDERSFSGGYRELHELADEDFSGVVRASGAELYMTRGVVVGIRMGDIEDFENANGTAYEAPAEALPLLAVMQERSDEVRAKYYSEDTSIATVDDTLSDGGFTGYIELSENVLSGDYYLVYHAGTSMAVAFVGESSKLIDGDEAFDTANDEVGIYQVRPVDIEPIEIPEPDDDAAAGAAGGEPTTDEPATGGEQAAGDESETASEPDAGQATAGGDAEPSPTEEPSPAGGAAGASAAGATATGETERETQSEAESTETTGQETAREETTADSRGSADSTANASAQTGATGQAEDPQSSRADQHDSRADQQTARANQQPSQDQQARETDTRQPTDREQTDEVKQAETNETGRTAQESAAQGSQRADRTATRQNEVSQRDTGGGRQQPAEGQSRPNDRTRTETESGRASEPQHSQPQGGAARSTGTGSAVAQDLEQRAVPSLDPDRTSIPDQTTEPEPPTPSSTSSQQPSAGAQPEPAPQDRPPQPEQNGRARPESQKSGEPAPADQQEPQPTQEPQSAQSQPAQQPATQEPEPAQQDQQAPTEVPDERVTELEAELDEKTEEIERLESELAEATEQRDDLQEQLAELEAERDELAAEVEQLENQLAQLEEEFGAATDADRRLTPAEALSGTDIFVRYHSKGKATLEKAHNGSPRREDVNDNMRLEKHTQFDADSASVGGQAYAEFLETTLEYQFVQWAVRNLLFEIRDTGHEKALKDLYDVLPKVDRAELSGVIRVTYTEDGQETQAEETFDVVLRDRMGNPLLVANLNDTREATTESMMEGLITSAERVGQSSDTFAGAFYVTESFFDPSALEIAEEATKGGLLSRDKRKSFVNLSRKNGYHLCLVEARNENFHLAVPEL